MAYIGRTPEVGNYSKLDDISASFNGSLTTFNLTVAGAAFTASTPSSLIVSVGGVLQEPEGAYTVSGSTITFTSPPAGSADFFAVALGNTLDIGTVSDGTITGAKLSAGSVTAGKIAVAGISSNTNYGQGTFTKHGFANIQSITVANSSGGVLKTLFGVGS